MAWLQRSPDRFGSDGQYAIAVKEFTKAIESASNDGSAHMDRGRCLFKWAIDKHINGVDKDTLDDPQLRNAQNDLRKAEMSAAWHYRSGRGPILGSGD